MMRTSTVEDTLKVMEISAQCLKLDMDKHSRTSFQTFKKKDACLVFIMLEARCHFHLQAAFNEQRWGCATVRSAVIARN